VAMLTEEGVDNRASCMNQTQWRPSGGWIWTRSRGGRGGRAGRFEEGDARETFSRVAPVAFKWGCGGWHRGEEMEGG
jgi:hypothetical protein